MRSNDREERNVIPRWRPLAGTEKCDLASVGRFRDLTHVNVAGDFVDHIAIWKEQGDLAAASDIFDTYILTGDRRSLVDAMRLARDNQVQIPPRLRDAIETAFRKREDPLQIRRRIAFQETDDDYVRKSIAVIKSRVKNFPRDALSYLEMARLHSVIGQFNLSERYLGIARALAPDNRVIIRATLQFYDTVSALEEGLYVIRKSDLLKFDPWIQSAEIATSTILGRQSRIASRRLVKFDKSGLVARESTELAMAIATLERASGIKERKFFKLVGEALPNATENGFSQAVWLSDHSSRDFEKRFPEAVPSMEAYEAKTQIAYEKKQFQEALGFATLWLEEQPFNVDAILKFLSLSSVHSMPTRRAINAANRYTHMFYDNWQVLNACLLVLAEGGEFGSASRVLLRMDKIVPHDSSRAFYEAAKGLLSFAEGNFAEGRASYERAAKIAAREKRFDLVVNSTIFLLRCEARNNLFSKSFFASISGLIEKSIKRVDLNHRSYLESVWYSSQSLISSSDCTTEDCDNSACEIAQQALDHTDLFALT